MVYERAWKEAVEVQTDKPTFRELNRHVSKGAWFSEPATAPWPLNQHTPPIISFFSFKGGVGRTTTLAACAVQLARARKRVCVIDLDLEAPGAGVLLNPAQQSARYGVVDYLLERPLHDGPALDVTDYVHACEDAAVIGTDGTPILVVPAGILDADYLEKLARVDYERINAQTPADSVFSNLLRDLRAAYDPHYFLIDSRAGLHDIGGLALNGLAHLDLVFSLDNAQSWAGLQLVVHHLGKRLIEMGKPQQACGLVFAMAPGPTTTERDDRHKAFLATAYDMFAESYYDAEADEDAEWPLPAPQAEDQPHHAMAIGFSEDIQKARSLGAAADFLTQGDFGRAFQWLLSRLGRTEP